MTTAKRILSLIIASWSLTIAAGGFTPQSGDSLRKSVWGCVAGKPANTEPSDPELDIYIQYCGGWGYGKKSKQLKKQLEDAFNTWKRSWSVREIRDPGVSGNFEVVVNGDKVWSKTNGQGFPSTQEKVETIIAAIKSKQTESTRIKTAIAGPDIHIQYCGGWGYGPKSKQLKKQLEEAFDGQISVRETRDPGVTGNFEVFVNGELVWSKRTRGQDFPTTKAEIDTICDEIRDRQE